MYQATGMITEAVPVVIEKTLPNAATMEAVEIMPVEAEITGEAAGITEAAAEIIVAVVKTAITVALKKDTKTGKPVK